MHVREAIESAIMAVSIERSAGNLDTLACAHARGGDFASAVSTAKEVITLAPSNQDFKLRLESFQSVPPRNCVGVD
jgi:Flp pilus assembly protein TadD